MINQFLLNVKQSSDLTIDGMEGLAVGEKVGLFFKELSLKYDKLFSSMRSTAHKVDFNSTAIAVKNQNPNYFKHQNSEIAIPSFFNPQKITWEDYCEAVNLAPAMVSAMLTETDRFYEWLKEIARNGKVGRSYNFTVSSTSQLLVKVDNFMNQLVEHKHSKGRLGDLYPSFGAAFDTMNQFNAAVLTTKARDIEVLAKSLNSVSAIGDLIVTKIKESEIVLGQGGLDALQRHFQTFVRYSNLTGVMVGLMNEQTAVFKDQLIDLKKMR